ncbi:hypothetical protein CBL_11313 [Carabus blaptoides fortunei]
MRRYWRATLLNEIIYKDLSCAPGVTERIRTSQLKTLNQIKRQCRSGNPQFKYLTPQARNTGNSLILAQDGSAVADAETNYCVRADSNKCMSCGTCEHVLHLLLSCVFLSPFAFFSFDCGNGINKRKSNQAKFITTTLILVLGLELVQLPPPLVFEMYYLVITEPRSTLKIVSPRSFVINRDLDPMEFAGAPL